MQRRLLAALLILPLLLAGCGPAPAAPTAAATQIIAPNALPTAEAVKVAPVAQEEFSLPPEELQERVRFELLGLSFVPADLWGGDDVKVKTFADGSQTVDTTFRDAVADPAAARRIVFTQSDLPLDVEGWFRQLAPAAVSEDARRETGVRGVSGYLYRNFADEPSLFWQENGLTYTLRLSSTGWPGAISDDLLLWLAESLQPADDAAYVFEHRAPSTWFTYTSAAHQLSFAVPRGWQQTGDAAFSGEDGFARLEAMKSYGAAVDQACEMEANLHPERYGSRPSLRSIRRAWNVVDIRSDPCLILPGADAPAGAEAALLLPDPSRPGQPAFLRLALDALHAELIAFSLDLPDAPTATPALPYKPPDPASLPASIEAQVSRLGSLTLESYPIVAASLDAPGHFEFAARIPGAVLARRADLRSAGALQRAFSITSAGRTVTVAEEADAIDHHYAVVSVDGQEVYRYAMLQHAGATPIYGLWNWAGRWVLEVNGALVVEGELYNAKAGYREIFNFRMLDGKPFFLFLKEGLVGVYYDGQTWPGLFESVVHGACCEAGIANPGNAAALTWFYAQQQGWWHYVELGLFERQSP